MRGVGLFFVACALQAQATFEVASVKPNRSNPPGSSISMGGRRLLAENFALRPLILMAWDLLDTQLAGGPAWIATERWDVDAMPESELPLGSKGNALMRAMLQSLLKERFHLEIHMEVRELPIYALTVAKGGSKLTHSASGATGGTSSGDGMLKASNTPLSGLARSLTGELGRTVLDETRMPGNFDIKLEFAPINGRPLMVNGREVDRPTIFTALQDQLGLKLESRKGPVNVIVIDTIERAREN